MLTYADLAVWYGVEAHRISEECRDVTTPAFGETGLNLDTFALVLIGLLASHYTHVGELFVENETHNPRARLTLQERDTGYRLTLTKGEHYWIVDMPEVSNPGELHLRVKNAAQKLCRLLRKEVHNATR